MNGDNNKFYTLPELPYDYDALTPYISENQLCLHHQKHHQIYANNANLIFEKVQRARDENVEINMKYTLKELSFNIGGHLLHSLFWKNLCHPDSGKKEPEGRLRAAILDEFGSFERFQKEFTQTALSVEGSGWAALIYCNYSHRPILMQIEKHNVNTYPCAKVLLVLDVWEHAYYIDYKNDRAKYIEVFWKIVNWKKVEERFRSIAS